MSQLSHPFDKGFYGLDVIFHNPSNQIRKMIKRLGWAELTNVLPVVIAIGQSKRVHIGVLTRQDVVSRIANHHSTCVEE